MAIQSVELNNGNAVPAIAYGLGTKWYKRDQTSGKLDETLVKAVEDAIDAGFTHIDNAEMYGTEEEFGEALKNSKTPRDNLFITTKVNVTPDKDPISSLEDSLKKLRLDYVDLFLIHTPFFRGVEEAWKKMETLHKEGKAKNIGVSNFGTEDLKKVLADAEVVPAVNQIEYHPYLQNQQPGIVKFCKDNNIQLEAYGPLVPIVHAPEGPLTPMLKSLAEKYSKTEAQILLRWVYQTGVVPITTSGKKARMTEYLGIFDFELDETDQNAISNAGDAYHYRQYFRERLEKK